MERNAVETRVQDKASGAMIRAGGQKMVAATFRHDTSRNLDPQLHTHAVIANMVQGQDGKWRTMVNDGLYRNKMAMGAIYQAELAQGLNDLGYRIEKTHSDGRFEIAGVSRGVVEEFSTRRAEIEDAMAARNEGLSMENPKLADRAALMTRARKRDVDKAELRRSWERQASEMGFSMVAIRAKAREAERETSGAGAGRLGARARGWTARGQGSRPRQALDDGRGHWAGVRGHRDDARRPGLGETHDAALDRGDEAPRRPSQRGPEESGQDGSLVEGPCGRSAGLCGCGGRATIRARSS